MTTLLIDARAGRGDGIGRIAENLVPALSHRAPADWHLTTMPVSSGRRYATDWTTQLAEQARALRAHALLTLDVPIPLTSGPPAIVWVHDVMRNLDPALCESETRLEARLGTGTTAHMQRNTAALMHALAQHDARATPSRGAHHAFLNARLAWTACTATAIIVPSRQVATQLADATDLRAPVHVVPYGVDHHAPPRNVPTALSHVPTARYALYVGQNRAHKQIDLLLQSFALLTSRRPDARLALVCADPPPNLPHGVERLRRVSDAQLAALYRHAACLVHLARHEGFGLTTAEALSHGTPVISLDTPVAREVLGPAASYVSNDPDSIANAIDAAIDNPVTDAERARRRRWAARYRWQTTADAVLDIIRATAP